jgi:hypothetical protein
MFFVRDRRIRPGGSSASGIVRAGASAAGFTLGGGGEGRFSGRAGGITVPASIASLGEIINARCRSSMLPMSSSRWL